MATCIPGRHGTAGTPPPPPRRVWRLAGGWRTGSDTQRQGAGHEGQSGEPHGFDGRLSGTGSQSGARGGGSARGEGVGRMCGRGLAPGSCADQSKQTPTNAP